MKHYHFTYDDEIYRVFDKITNMSFYMTPEYWNLINQTTGDSQFNPFAGSIRTKFNRYNIAKK